jgi:hypothetical protein
MTYIIVYVICDELIMLSCLRTFALKGFSLADIIRLHVCRSTIAMGASRKACNSGLSKRTRGNTSYTT